MLAAPPRPPWWRDERVLKVVFQVIFVLIAAATLGTLFSNMLQGLQRAGLTPSFNFLRNSANFGISEGIRYDPSESYFKAFIVGLVNTIWVSAVSIILATLLGLLLGIARLSSNWLARQLAFVVTEVFRNIPVLLIIVFWYQGVLIRLPGVANSYSIGGIVYLSQRGIVVPSLTASIWLVPALLIAIASAAFAVRKAQEWRWLWGIIAFGIAFAIVTLLSPSVPLAVQIPELQRFNFRGGWQFSTEYMAMVIGLVTYTGAYIAEVVRGSFLAVQRGQLEASRALGLSEMQTFQLVIVPQALRIMLPSLNTQFLTLIKNSSLAIAVGFPDVFNVSSTIINQSGRSIETFGLVMAAYLVMNLVISYGMNWLNNRVKLVER